MKNLCSAVLMTCGALLPYLLSAQSNNSGILKNNGGIVDNYPTLINTADGNYTGTNSGKFNHFGPSTLTFTNNGTYGATTGHTDVFKGPDGAPGAQEIGGSKRPSFFNVEFVNGSGSPIYISNAQGIFIGGNLNFGNGITSTLRNLNQTAGLVFGAGATYSNANNDNQHVNGYVSKIGNTAFVFPVGSGTDIRTLGISAPKPSSAHLATAWIPGNPGATIDPSDTNPYHPVSSVTSPIISVSDVGQWDWISVVDPTNAIIVKVSMPDMSKFALATYLRLVGWNGSSWVNLSSGVSASDITENSTLTGTIGAGQKITALGIGSTQAPLPVHLVSFTAKVIEKSEVRLDWTTTSELNNDYFEIEYSRDARNFEPVGRINGNGTVLAEKSDYSFTHQLPPATFGSLYYRLKQVDFDGSYAYSTLREVRLAGDMTLVYPNPATSEIKIDIGDWRIMESVELFDAAGRNVYKSREIKQTIQIDSHFFPGGAYLLRFKFADGSYATRQIMIAN